MITGIGIAKEIRKELGLAPKGYNQTYFADYEREKIEAAITEDITLPPRPLTKDELTTIYKHITDTHISEIGLEMTRLQMITYIRHAIGTWTTANDNVSYFYADEAYTLLNYLEIEPGSTPDRIMENVPGWHYQNGIHVTPIKDNLRTLVKLVDGKKNAPEPEEQTITPAVGVDEPSTVLDIICLLPAAITDTATGISIHRVPSSDNEWNVSFTFTRV